MSINCQEDLDLTRQQVQSLSSTEAIAAFFAYLRYPDEARLPMTAEALALSGDLARAVHHVERLSSVDLGLDYFTLPAGPPAKRVRTEPGDVASDQGPVGAHGSADRPGGLPAV